MSNDGFQIEIPTFDDEQDSSLFPGKPTFGGGFGGGGSSFGGGQGISSALGGGNTSFGYGSPNPGTSPFSFGSGGEAFGGGRSTATGFHNRGDSANSDMSGRSFQFGGSHLRQNNNSTEAFATGGSVTPQPGSSEAAPFPRTPSKTSLTSGAASNKAGTGSTPGSFNFPSRKHSFASIRNAFKSSKSNAGQDQVPPLPSLDPQQALPALRNPFARSASSLSHHAPGASKDKRPRGVPITSKSPNPSYSARFVPPGYSRTRSNSHAPSAHSHSSSIAHSEYSDQIDGSPGISLDASVPPVPQVPDEYGANVRRHRNSPSVFSEVGGSISTKPQKPHEYAIHVLFMKFVTLAEHLVEVFISLPLYTEPLLVDALGPEINSPSEFGTLLDSLAQLARKHAHPVIDSIMRWRNSHRDQPIDTRIVEKQTVKSRDKFVRPIDVMQELSRRKELATIYVMCRALVVIMKSVGKDGLELRYGDQLEGTFFEEFVSDPASRLLSHSPNYRINAELYAMILGEMSNIRFISVTDRFIAILQPLALGHVIKDGGARYENIIRGLDYIKLKVYPSEAFDEAAEFMESLSKAFANAHGQPLKSAFAEVLTRLMHPIAKTAMHEVNHPMWAKAIELMYPKASLMSKPRYWIVSYPLVVTLLCVAPHEYFLRNWIQCTEMSIAKLKEKASRQAALNGILRLVWTYLYRCQEPASTTTTKIDTLLRHFFPTKWRVTYPFEDGFDSLACILHYILFRHPAHGRDTVLELMQESTIQSMASNISMANFADMVPVDRVAIVVRATVLYLHSLETETTPSWPNGTNFFVSPLLEEDVQSMATVVPAEVLSKAGVQDFHDRISLAIGRLTTVCGSMVGGMTTNESRYRLQSNLTYEEREDLVIRHHPSLGISTVYHEPQLPGIETLRICVQSLPRMLHPSGNTTEVLDLLIRLILHIEPKLAEEAELALNRFAASDKYIQPLLARLTRFIFAPYNNFRDSGATQGAVTQMDRLINLWVHIMTTWAERLSHSEGAANAEETGKDIRAPGVATLTLDIESGGLYLLSSTDVFFRQKGIEALKAIQLIDQRLSGQNIEATPPKAPTGKRLIEVIDGISLTSVGLPNQNLPVTDVEYARLHQWKDTVPAKPLAQIAQSQDDVDGRLWRFILPCVVRACLDQTPIPFMTCRDAINASVLRYHSLISGLSQVVKSPQTTFPRSPPLARNAPQPQQPKSEHIEEREQWKTWIVVLCSAARDTTDIRSPTKDHARIPSDPTSQRDRLSTPRGLLRYLIPFLMAEEPWFRSAAIQALGCIHRSAYKKLLEDLQSLTTRIYDDAKAQAGQDNQRTPLKGRRERLGDRLHTAVMQVYRLTSHFAQDEECLADDGILSLLLQFVRETRTYLSDPELPLDIDALRVRRFFCGVVEMLFLGMASRKGADDMMSASTRLSLFRLCQEWCASGLSPAQKRRYDDMMSGQMSNQSFATEANKLSKTAAAAMTALCSPSFLAVDITATSPVQVDGSGLDEPLEVSTTIEWLSALFRETPDGIKQGARKALRSLLSKEPKPPALVDEVLRRAFYSSEEPLENQDYFTVVADFLLEEDKHGLETSQVICFGLSNLCSPSTDRRARAFDVLEKAVVQSRGRSSKDLAIYEAGVRSPDAATYLEVRLQVSDVLAELFPDESHAVVSQCALRLPQTQCQHQFMLKTLEPWVSACTLLSETSEISPEGHSTLVNLLALTVHYVDLKAKDIQALWQKLVERPLTNHAVAVVKFLLEETLVRASPESLGYAQSVLAGLSRTEFGSLIYEELCMVVESIGDITRGTPTDLRDRSLNISSTLYTANLNNLVPTRNKLSLSMGQAALILVSEMTIERPWDFQAQLTIVLHGIFTHLDHSQLFLQNVMRAFLFRLLWAWMPGYYLIPETLDVASPRAAKESIRTLENKKDAIFWSLGDADPKTTNEGIRKMKKLCAEVISILEPLFPSLRQTWGELAIRWVSQCPVPNIARRSIQVLRAVMPDIKLEMVSSILHRLSNIISDPSRQIQAFSKEILLTLRLIVRSPQIDPSLVPLLFWSATAFLSTTVETEFSLAIDIFDGLLDQIDMENNTTAENLLYSKPPEWKGDQLAVRALATVGLRSSATYDDSFSLLQRLAKLPLGNIVESRDDRLRYLYTIALPWCLHAMESKPIDPSLAEFAMDLAAIAEADERDGIQRIMISFAKSRFRTKDDFLRQAVGCLREYFMAQHSTEVITILLGLVLNEVSWIRVKSMQILKLVFGHAETRNPLILHGSDLLMPLLRLLNTDLGQQALEVLDEPLAVSGGPTPAQLLRMSMHMGTQTSEPSADIFGVPSESGWCIAKPEAARDACRHNVLAVYTTFQQDVPGPVSMIMFEEDEENMQELEDGEDLTAPAEPMSDEASVANLVNTLHDLGEFFQADHPTTLHPSNVEDRVAMILNRSLGRSTGGQTLMNSREGPTSSSEWDEGNSAFAAIPGTPGPFAQLFSSPQNTMDNLQRNFGMDSDESDVEAGAMLPIRQSSSPGRYVSSDEEESAFGLEDPSSTKGRKSLRNIIGSKLSSKNGKPERRRP